MSTDLTFFTNEPDRSLLDRFRVAIEHNTRFFDVLVGFFRTSGFYKLYKSLEKTEKIRILVGISLNRYAYQLIQKAGEEKQLSLRLSHSEVKDDFKENIISEMENSPDRPEVEKGIRIGRVQGLPQKCGDLQPMEGEDVLYRFHQ